MLWEEKEREKSPSQVDCKMQQVKFWCEETPEKSYLSMLKIHEGGATELLEGKLDLLKEPINGLSVACQGICWSLSPRAGTSWGVRWWQHCGTCHPAPAHRAGCCRQAASWIFHAIFLLPSRAGVQSVSTFWVLYKWYVGCFFWLATRVPFEVWYRSEAATYLWCPILLQWSGRVKNDASELK